MSILVNTHSSAIVFPPKENYHIAKYLDLIKFLSILQRKSLFFCRLDKLEDKFEGTTAKANYEFRKNIRRSLFTRNNMTSLEFDELVDEKTKEYYEFEEKQKALYCVNCWNKFTNESTALWKIYSSLNQGLIIKSNIDSLKLAFDSTKERVQLSEINYIDYNTQTMLDENSNFPVIHKHISFKYEEEIRLLHSVESDSDWKFNWAEEEVEEGKYIKVDIEKLVTEIIISPFAPNWFFIMIENLCATYGLNKPILKSELSI